MHTSLRNQAYYGLTVFFLSVIFFEHICGIVFKLIYLSIFIKADTYQAADYVQYAISFSLSVAYVLISKRALETINSNTALTSLHYGQGSDLILSYHEASYKIKHQL